MMTENQWTTAGQSSPQDTDAVLGTTSAVTADADGGSTSKKDAVKEEASNVAGQAAAAAQAVAGTAKEEASNVASEVKSSAQDLLSQAKTGLTGQAGTQQQKAAEGIRTISSQLQSMAEAPDQQGIASDLIRQAAQRSEAVASWLENKEPGDLLGDVQRFARNRPGTFLLLAAGAGVLAGRLTKGLAAGAPAPQTSAAIPPQPVQAPATEAIVTSGTGEPFSDLPGSPATYDTTYPVSSSPANQLGSPQLVEEEPWSGTRAAEDPLGDPRLAADPLDDDPLARDRRAGGQSGGF
jgi:hypothetical protein